MNGEIILFLSILISVLFPILRLIIATKKTTSKLKIKLPIITASWIVLLTLVSLFTTTLNPESGMAMPGYLAFMVIYLIIMLIVSFFIGLKIDNRE